MTYSVFGPGGKLEDAGDDWAPLVRRLESATGSFASAATVIWP